jgi:hypothetical protein
MAKQTETPAVDGPDEVAATDHTPAADLGINPDEVPGTAKTILATRPGYAFESGVEGVDTITEHGTRVAQNKIDAVFEAAAPSGEGFIFVVDQG